MAKSKTKHDKERIADLTAFENEVTAAGWVITETDGEWEANCDGMAVGVFSNKTALLEELERLLCISDEDKMTATRSRLELLGWVFSESESGWLAHRNEDHIGPYDTEADLIEWVAQTQENLENFSPEFPAIPEDVRLPVATKVELMHEGKAFKGVITGLTSNKSRYVVKCLVGGVESEFYRLPQDLTTFEPVQTLAIETAAVESDYDRAVQLLTTVYFDAHETENARHYGDADAAKNLLCNLAGERTGNYKFWSFATIGTKIHVSFADGNEPTIVPIATIASRVVDELLHNSVWPTTESEVGEVAVMTDEDFSNEVEKSEQSSLSSDESEQLSELIEKGWRFVRGDGTSWKAQKTINGKSVEVVNDELGLVFAQIEELEPEELEEDTVPVKPLEELPKTEITKCRFDLTDKEILIKSASLMETFRNIEAHVAKLEEFRKDHKRQMIALEKRKDELIGQIENKVEFRPVECDLEYDFARSIVKFIRPDTGEEAGSRQMDRDELRIRSEQLHRERNPALF